MIGKDRFCQFQISASALIQNHVTIIAVVRNFSNVIKTSFLGTIQKAERCSGSEFTALRNKKLICIFQMKMFRQYLIRIFFFKILIIELCN